MAIPIKMNYLIKNRWTITLLVLGAFILGVAYFNRAEAVNSITFFWRVEGTTLDGTHDFSAGDTTATLNETAAINTDAALVGTNGLDAPSSADYAIFVVSSGDIIDMNEGAAAFAFRINSGYNGQTLFTAFNSASLNMHIRVNSIGTDDATGRELDFRIRFTGGAHVGLETTDADLQTGTIYYCVIRWDNASNDRRMEIYNSDGSLRTAVENLSIGWDVPTGIDTMWFGLSGGIGSPDWHFDNLFIASDYNEPLEDKLDITSWTEYESSASILPVEIRGGTNVRGGVIFR